MCISIAGPGAPATKASSRFRSALNETGGACLRAAQQPVFSPDGRTLYTVSHDRTPIAWDVVGDRVLARRGFPTRGAMNLMPMQETWPRCPMPCNEPVLMGSGLLRCDMSG